MIVALVAVIALVLAVLIPLPAGPLWIARESPQEERRIVHPKGFSIVKPPGWFARIELEKDGAVDQIHLRATEKLTREYTGITVTAVPRSLLTNERAHPYYISNYHETVF